MKPYTLHVPLTERERKAILAARKRLGITQGQYVRKMMYGKLSPQELLKRADTSDGVEISVKWPEMRHPVKLKPQLAGCSTLC